MTSILTRQPLEQMPANRVTHDSALSRRRSVRTFDEGADSGAPPAKKQRVDGTSDREGTNGRAAARTNARKSTKGEPGRKSWMRALCSIARSHATDKSLGDQHTDSRTAYDEADDGFTFSRTKSKRAGKVSVDAPKHTAARAAERKLGSPTAPAPAAISVNKKRPRKTLPVTPEKDDGKPPVRRSSRLSGESQPAATRVEAPAVASGASRRQLNDHVSAQGRQTGDGRGSELYVEKNKPFTRIVLELGGETPKNHRNKAFRQGALNDSSKQHRRSSGNLRGKRVSSLGMNVPNTSAQPHAEVAVEDFYKHIRQDDLETKRTRQLLVWCATRALKERKKGVGIGKEAEVAEVQAQHSARIVSEELLEDFKNRIGLSDWFDRPANPAQSSGGVALVKKPNPRNVQNATKLVELEAELARLKAEKQSWDDLVASIPGAKRMSASLSSPQDLQAAETAAEAMSDPRTALDPRAINAAVLADESQSALLASLLNPSVQVASDSNEPHTPATDVQGARTTEAHLQSRLDAASSQLHFKLDSLADALHRLERYVDTAGRVAGRVGQLSAARLEERERERERGARAVEGAAAGRVGDRELLRALGRAMGGGGGSGVRREGA